MCDIIKIGEGTTIICGRQPHDHNCDEKASVYETNNGQRFYFRQGNEGDKWYRDNYKIVRMGSVACSVCGGAMIDNAWKM